MSKFTPGPWQKNRYGDLTGSDGTRVAVANAGISLEMSYPHSEATVANTHLLIACPEMYEVVLAMANFDGRQNNTHLKEMARAALARAEGRS